MLSVSEDYIRKLNADARPLLFGQDWNDEAWAVCKSDMLIKGEDADNIRLGDTFRNCKNETIQRRHSRSSICKGISIRPRSTEGAGFC
jgi:type I restriction-modification system DNA methylase subunit